MIGISTGVILDWANDCDYVSWYVYLRRAARELVLPSRLRKKDAEEPHLDALHFRPCKTNCSPKSVPRGPRRVADAIRVCSKGKSIVYTNRVSS